MLETVLPREMQRVCQLGDTADRRKYYYIRGANGKAWLLPCASCRMLKVALAIYQPVANEGLGFKLLFPYFASNRYFRKLIGRYIQVAIVDISLRDEFMAWVEGVFQIRDPILSFYLGYPNIMRKSTCQVSDEKSNILGYAKFSDDTIGSNMIRGEADFLQHYAQKVDGIPERLDFRNDLLGLTILAQTTIKTGHESERVNVLNQQHMRFLQQVREKTMVTMNYRSTKYYLNQQHYLETVLVDTTVEDIEIIRAATDIINSMLGDREVAFSVAHRDFKPPNICFADGRIMVFDWEVASNEYPPFYDLFEFVTLDWRNQRMPAKKIWGAVKTYIADHLVTRYTDYTLDALVLYFLMFQIDRTLLWLSLNPGRSIHEDTALIDEIIESNIFDSHPT